MNRYLIVHRMRWPAFLLLTGILALLNEQHIVGWSHSWPLYLILLGVFALAERALLSQDPPPDVYPFAGYPAGYAAGYPAQGYAPPVQPVAPAPIPSTEIVPSENNLSIRPRGDEEQR